MNMPGFTAELSLMRKGHYHQRFAAHSMARLDMIQPALPRFVPLVSCYCAEYQQNPIAGYDCVRVECIEVPFPVGL